MNHEIRTGYVIVNECDGRIEDFGRVHDDIDSAKEAAQKYIDNFIISIGVISYVPVLANFSDRRSSKDYLEPVTADPTAPWGDEAQGLAGG